VTASLGSGTCRGGLACWGEEVAASKWPIVVVVNVVVQSEFKYESVFLKK
jgi:hypothetical protein